MTLDYKDLARVAARNPNAVKNWGDQELEAFAAGDPNEIADIMGAPLAFVLAMQQEARRKLETIHRTTEDRNVE